MQAPHVSLVVVCCKGLAKLLAVTLPYTKQQFSRVVVVTERDDQATLDLCTAANVGFCTSDKKGKAALINAALASSVDGIDWVCLLDVDIIIPSQVQFDWPALDTRKLYSALRRQARTVEDGVRPVASLPLAADPPFVGGELQPLGYFQLWNWRCYPRRYPISAEEWSKVGWTRADIDFSRLWPTQNRALLPFEVIHLGSPREHWGGS